MYLVFRPPGATPGERAMIETANREFVARYSPDNVAQQLALLADLQDRGKISDAEYAAQKARLLNGDHTALAPS